MTDTYPISPRNKVRQLKEKARYEKDTVHQLLDSGLVAHVGFVQDGAPVVVPMIYGREDEIVYLHGARKARVIRLLEQTECICLNVTMLDAIVLARSAFNSSMNYRSVTVFGKPRLLETDDEKLHAMRVISEHTMPGRWDELRAPHDREVKMTGVIAVDVETGSAKISAKMPDDDPEDYDIPVWAGILPLTTRTGALQEDSRLVEGVEPSGIVLAMQHRMI
ncbi:MAG TPA: pyridoxamine 5'-phosphate oxidase family protein [Woeseiaceae bacterium]|nr:pyridoxamine 5'-phosphate oxidase family protein [Woeseiaceae bacterium]